MKSLQDKTVVITGAGSGIGRALAHLAYARGANLALTDINADGLAETVKDLDEARVLTGTLDVAQRSQWTAHRKAVNDRFGSADVIINNAGVAVSQRIEDLTYDDFEWIMGINFWGVVYGTKTFLSDLKARPESAVVNISSLFGLIGVPTQGAYNAAKFAVRGFTEALRHEMADTPVHVMSVHPGGVKTNIARNARFYEGPSGGNRDSEVEMFDKIARTTPESAAKRILDDLQAGRYRCLVGGDARVLDWVQRMMPSGYGGILRSALRAGR